MYLLVISQFFILYYVLDYILCYCVDHETSKQVIFDKTNMEHASRLYSCRRLC